MLVTERLEFEGAGNRLDQLFLPGDGQLELLLPSWTNY